LFRAARAWEFFHILRHSPGQFPAEDQVSNHEVGQPDEKKPFSEGGWARMMLYLQVLSGKMSGQEIKIKKPRFMIGRGADCDLKPKSEDISRHQCLIELHDHGAVIRDLGSANGTFVNHTRLSGARMLQQDDMLEVGPLQFRVRMEDEFSSNVSLVELPPEEEGPTPTTLILHDDRNHLITSAAETRILQAGALPTLEEAAFAALTADQEPGPPRTVPAKKPALPVGSKEELARVLHQALNQYCQGHTGLGKQQVLGALWAVQQFVERS